MKSGMLAAEAAFEALTNSEASSAAPVDLGSYEAALKSSWVWEELRRERNIRPACAPFPPALLAVLPPAPACSRMLPTGQSSC